MTNLKDIILQNIPIEQTPSGGGWHRILCRVCGDRGHKGKRAGFKFDGNKVVYHCFNGSCGAVFDPDTQSSVPPKMAKVLEAYGVGGDQYKQLEFELFASLKPKNSHAVLASDIKYPSELSLPNHFYKLDPLSQEPWSQVAILYLEDRGISPSSYAFFLSTDKDWAGRLIIPIYREGKLIFYQGRDMTGKKTLKYKSADVIRNSVLFGYDQLYQNTSAPLFILEGFFDALLMNGVAVFSNKMTDDQMQILNKSPRPKVIIPDMYGRGFVLAEQGLILGWSIAFPDIGQCKDINESIQKYGQLYTFGTINANIKSGLESEIMINSYLKH